MLSGAMPSGLAGASASGSFGVELDVGSGDGKLVGLPGPAMCVGYFGRGGRLRGFAA